MLFSFIDHRYLVVRLWIAARQDAKKFYQPLLWIVNIVFLLLRIVCWSSRNISSTDEIAEDLNQRIGAISWWMHVLPQGWPELVMWLAFLGLQYYSYVGILDHAATHSSSNSSALVGGSYLDLFAVTILIQYIGGLLWTPMYWCCCIFPLWGAYSLYQTMTQQKSPVANNAAVGQRGGLSTKHSSSLARTFRRDNTTSGLNSRRGEAQEEQKEESPSKGNRLRERIADRRQQRKERRKNARF